jgi:hypothetical protein
MCIFVATPLSDLSDWIDAVYFNDKGNTVCCMGFHGMKA